MKIAFSYAEAIRFLKGQMSFHLRGIEWKISVLLDLLGHSVYYIYQTTFLVFTINNSTVITKQHTH